MALFDKEIFEEKLVSQKFPDWEKRFNPNLGNPQRKKMIGHHFNIGFKYYFKQSGFEGVYLGPVYSFEQSRSKINKIELRSGQVYRLEDHFDIEKSNSNMFGLRLGSQKRFYETLTDVFIYVGKRVRVESTQDIGIRNNIAESDFLVSKYSSFFIKIGLALGFYF